MISPRRRSVLPVLLLPLLAACAPSSPPAPAANGAAAAQHAPGTIKKDTELSRAARRVIKARVREAYGRKDFATCANLYEALGDSYWAGVCLAQGGHPEAAFTQLALALENPRRDLSKIDPDAELAVLAGDPRWPAERAKLLARRADDTSRIHPELQRLYQEDQADRKIVPLDLAWLAPRDRRRREQVGAILAAGGARSSIDCFRAAMVFHHGETVEDFRLANQLVRQAVELDPDHDGARWLAAAAEDRLLMEQKQPQKWGTQFDRVDGVWVVWEVDPAITDAQRAEWNVPPLAAARSEAQRLNAAGDP